MLFLEVCFCQWELFIFFQRPFLPTKMVERSLMKWASSFVEIIVVKIMSINTLRIPNKDQNWELRTKIRFSLRKILSLEMRSQMIINMSMLDKVINMNIIMKKTIKKLDVKKTIITTMTMMAISTVKIATISAKPKRKFPLPKSLRRLAKRDAQDMTIIMILIRKLMEFKKMLKINLN
jgi:hypothetical protein